MKSKVPEIFKLLWVEDDNLARLLRAHRPDLYEKAKNKPTSRVCNDYIILCKEIEESGIPGLDELI